jgi:two-component system response regulator
LFTKCEFHCVKDGLQVLDYLNRRGGYQDAESSPRQDLILLDLNLPSMSGREALQKLKADQRFRAIPVIILTTSSHEEDVAFCYDAGANTYIIKEPSFAGLLAAFKVVKEYWLETATLPPKGDLQTREKDRETFLSR